MILFVPFTMRAFRTQLRAQREERVGGREKLADLTGINKTTIQNAENGPDVPQIDTVARLVEAMPGLTLSSFFARIEGLPTDATAMQDLPGSPESSLVTPDESKARSDAKDAAIDTLAEIVAEFLAQRAAAKARAAHRQAPDTGVETPERDLRRRSGARRTVRRTKPRPPTKRS